MLYVMQYLTGLKFHIATLYPGLLEYSWLGGTNKWIRNRKLVITVLFGKRSSYMFVSWTADVIAEIWVFYNKKGDLIGNLCWCVFDCNFYYYSLPLVSSNSTSDVWTSFNIGSTKSGLRWRTLKPFQSNISSWRESQFRGSLIPQGKKKTSRIYHLSYIYPNSSPFLSPCRLERKT